MKKFLASAVLAALALGGTAASASAVPLSEPTCIKDRVVVVCPAKPVLKKKTTADQQKRCLGAFKYTQRCKRTWVRP